MRPSALAKKSISSDLLPDLGVQRLQIRPRFAFLTGGGKHLGRTLQQLGLPLRDLVRVNIEALGQLRQRLV